MFKLPFIKASLSITNLENVTNIFPPGSEKHDVHGLQSEMEITFESCLNHKVNSLNELFMHTKKFKGYLGKAFKLCI